MKREIKFRAWVENHANGESVMFYTTQGTNMQGDRGLKCCGGNKPSGSLSYFMGGRSPLMQYTGLKDKNGTEIYEGDLLSHKYYSSPVEVTFEQGSFVSEDVVITDGSLEVIGNIHENKDLLTNRRSR